MLTMVYSQAKDPKCWKLISCCSILPYQNSLHSITAFFFSLYQRLLPKVYSFYLCCHQPLRCLLGHPRGRTSTIEYFLSLELYAILCCVCLVIMITYLVSLYFVFKLYPRHQAPSSV